MEDEKRRRKRHFLLWVAVLLAGLFAGRQVGTWPAKLRYPGEGDFVEGIHLVEMLHLRQGVAVYAPASPQRFDAMIYGPLYYLLGAQLIDPEQPAYRPFRLLSLLATLGLAAGCALLAYWLAKSYRAGVLAALGFLAYGFIIQYGASLRADSLAVCLFFWGFLIAYRFRDSRKVFLAIPLMLLGFYYKQQALAGPLAVLLFLVLEKRYRRAAEFVCLLAAGGLSLCLFFEFGVFRGQAFFLHFVLYNLIPWSRHSFLTGLTFFGVVLALPVLLGIEYLRAYPDKLLSCYLGCACLVGLLTCGRTGSDTNYFLECAITPVVLVAALIAARIAQPGRAPELLVLLLLMLLLGQFFTLEVPSPRDFSRDLVIQEFLRRNFPPRTPALGFYAGDLIRAGLESPISDLYLYAQLIRKGTLADLALRDDIDRRRFGVIVVDLDLRNENAPLPYDYCITKPLRHAILQNYRLAASLELPGVETHYAESRFNVWVPR
jgi:hypothetical protein